MHVTRITTTEALQQLAPAWNGLADGIPFRTWQWLFNWWKHYGAGKSLYTLAVHDDDGVLVAVAPWFIEDRGNEGRVVQFLGSGHVCSEYLTILTTPEHGHAAVLSIAQWLVRAADECDEADNQWDLLDFEGVAVGDACLQRLVCALQANRCTFNRRPGMDCWRLAMPASWEAFAGGLTGSHKKQIRKVRRRLFDSGRAVVRTVRDPAELALGMRIFVELHQLRWIALGEPGCFASTEFSGFMHACAVDLLAAEMLHLSWLEIEGKPVAVEFLLGSADTRYVYQGGLDPSARKDSPGHALMSAVFCDAMEAGCQVVDFLRGDEPYKATWGALPTKTERLRVAPGRLGPQLRNHAWLAGQVMKDWVKQGLILTGVH